MAEDQVWHRLKKRCLVHAEIWRKNHPMSHASSSAQKAPYCIIVVLGCTGLSIADAVMHALQLLPPNLAKNTKIQKFLSCGIIQWPQVCKKDFTMASDVATPDTLSILGVRRRAYTVYYTVRMWSIALC